MLVALITTGSINFNIALKIIGNVNFKNCVESYW